MQAPEKMMTEGAAKIMDNIIVCIPDVIPDSVTISAVSMLI
jgi:hypothetical protein